MQKVSARWKVKTQCSPDLPTSVLSLWGASKVHHRNPGFYSSPKRRCHSWFAPSQLDLCRAGFTVFILHRCMVLCVHTLFELIHCNTSKCKKRVQGGMGAIMKSNVNKKMHSRRFVCSCFGKIWRGSLYHIQNQSDKYMRTTHFPLGFLWITIPCSLTVSIKCNRFPFFP